MRIETLAFVGATLTVLALTFVLFLYIRYADAYYYATPLKSMLCCLASAMAIIIAKGELPVVIKCIAIAVPVMFSLIEVIIAVKFLKHFKEEENQ